jgi:hypothetical protein
MNTCPTKEAIEDAFDRILKSTGFNIKQKLSECQIGGKGKRKRRMKGGVISKQNIITGIYLLISLTITYFVNKGINEGYIPNVEEFKQILNGNCVTVLQSYYPEQSSPMCSIIRSNLLLIVGAIYKKNIPAILYIAGIIFFNKKSASFIMSAVDALADEIMNYVPKLNEVKLEEAEETPSNSILDNINTNLLLERDQRVTHQIGNNAVVTPTGFGAVSGKPSIFGFSLPYDFNYQKPRTPVSQIYPMKTNPVALPNGEGPNGGKRKTRRCGNKTMKGGSKHHMSKKRKHRKRTRRA